MRFRAIAAGMFVVTRRFTNVYAIVDGDRTVLVDTGDPSFAVPLLRAVAPLPPVRDIVLTHGHYDHAGSAARMAGATGATVRAHPDIANMLRTGAWRRAAAPSPTPIGRILTRLVADRFPDRIAHVAGAAPITGDRLDLAGGLDVVDLPGHAAGQIGLGVGLADRSKAWIVGDAV